MSTSRKLGNTAIIDIAQQICQEDSVSPQNVFPVEHRQTLLRFAKEIEDRSLSLNDQLHRTNYSRLAQAITSIVSKMNKNQRNAVSEELQIFRNCRNDIQNFFNS